MAYGDAITDPLPVVGSTAGPTYATRINTFLEAIQAVVEAKVNPTGMDMSSDLSFLSNGVASSVTDLKSAAFDVQGTALDATLNPACLYFADGSGELYVNDASGNQVQITFNGDVLTTSTGAITGAGYGDVGVAVNWSAGATAYQLFSGAGTYAGVETNKVKVHDGSGNFASIDTASLASDYTLTLPAAVPASQALVQVEADGDLVFSNTVPTAATFSAGLTAATFLVSSGNATLGSTTFTVEPESPNRELAIPPAAFQVNQESGGFDSSYPPLIRVGLGAIALLDAGTLVTASSIIAPLMLFPGCVINTIKLYYLRSTGGSSSDVPTLSLRRHGFTTASTNTVTLFTATGPNTTSGSIQTLTITTGGYELTATDFYTVCVAFPTGVFSADYYLGASVNYKTNA